MLANTIYWSVDNDATISDIAENLLYTGALGNAGEGLILRDSTGQLIDVVGSDAWFNDNEEFSRKQHIPSLERISLENSGIESDNWSNHDSSTVVGAD